MAMGVLAALQARERTGQGQMVDTSLFSAALTLGTWPVTFALNYGFDIQRPPRSKIANPLVGFYECADGEWIHLIMPPYEKHWPTFSEVIGIKELEKDPRFSTLAAVADNCEEMIVILDRIFATKPRAEWMSIFAEHDFPCAAIKKAVDLADDPQAIENEYIIESDHPVYGHQKMVGFPYNFSKTPAALRRPSPGFGQHTEEVLLELGYDWDGITKLREGEVI